MVHVCHYAPCACLVPWAVRIGDPVLWVLGIDESPARAASALNHGATSPAPGMSVPIDHLPQPLGHVRVVKILF